VDLNDSSGSIRTLRRRNRTMVCRIILILKADAISDISFHQASSLGLR